MSSSDTAKVPIVEYCPPSSFATDMKVLKHMWFAKIVPGQSQQDRLESFYKHQADLYDSYRFRMLHARMPMIKAMPLPPKGKGVWLDIGGGTGSNLEYFAENLNHFAKVMVLDLCPSLAAQAEERVKRHPGWSSFVQVIVADACDEKAVSLPPAGSVDVITFSYALSMIPDWKAALANAKRLLKKGGHLCVCDFTVDETQGWGMQTMWSKIFASDHVYLRAEHRPFLREQFKAVHDELGFGTFPYVPPVMRAPWYVFVGQKV
ncbi:sam-dependent methlyltransferase [Nannochloropsis oceanica]|uniref:Betaine lipid synthase 1S n=1 Tax=Nannochloropsis oceanica TaxID=145522 RepID=A0A348AZ80_9STRA|nr:betaine lipid synthase 1S [Nannochloropsis oceanica]